MGGGAGALSRLYLTLELAGALEHLTRDIVPRH
jgi:hypothetical protein